MTQPNRNFTFIDHPTGLGILVQGTDLKILFQNAAEALMQIMLQKNDTAQVYTRQTLSVSGMDYSERAVYRGLDQLGTLGSGNHFLEIQTVDQIYDAPKARQFHLFEGQVVLLIHSGSRGFDYQICDDFLKEMSRISIQQNIHVADRQLACAYLQSEAGRRYFSAMACAANYAWANRQVLMHLAMEKSFGSSCHGAGRILSRSQAIKAARGRAIHRELEDQGIYVQYQGLKTLKEEIPEAYKDVSKVVEVVHEADLAKKVARLRPLGVIKGCTVYSRTGMNFANEPLILMFYQFQESRSTFN